MDSDHDIYDMDSEEEVFSDDGTIDEPLDSQSKKNYRILKDKDICQLMKNYISRTSMILSVPRDVSLALVLHYKWNIYRANEEWFANQSKVRKAIGMLSEKETENPLRKRTFSDSNSLLTCGICFEEYSLEKVAFGDCKHPFCKVCWEYYISTSINIGPKCLVLRCPKPSCNIMVGQSVTVILASEKDRLKYYDYLIRSYVEENRRIEWCPAPGCKNAVKIFDILSENYDVICDCSNVFCWNCLDENHRPIDCDTIAKWRIRNLEEAENTNWILAFTKKCPKCKNAIEKNMGCMHMTCRCLYQFCWLCLEEWVTCYGNCNRYVENKEIKEAKKNVRRYTHYYERWMSNEKSKQKALQDLNKMRDEGVKKLSELDYLYEDRLEFIVLAWKQIVECRRVLKWSYAYGFYLPEKEKTKMQFFEFLQGEAEAGLERLHYCAEKELLDHLGSTEKLDYTEQGFCENFKRFRSKLIWLTKVTGDYFDNLVIALENSLKDVSSSSDINISKLCLVE
ncbi:putative E3 ubiquitin-protein ligase ARI8 [Nicotiana tabacum]|uniref:E3 ubiquitin-protein ligase ARI8 n=1 Tax=Nicotiana tabacum TaxID=4097 RepID=A0AC58S0H0_TOBAC